MPHLFTYFLKFLEWYYIVNMEKLDAYYMKAQAPAAEQPPRLVTQSKAARMIGISDRQTRRFTTEGTLRSYQNRRGRDIRYEYDVVVEFCFSVYGRKPIED